MIILCMQLYTSDKCHAWFHLYIGWLVVLRINVDLAIFQPYLDLEAGDDQSLNIQVARPGIEPRSSCSASQELYRDKIQNEKKLPIVWLEPTTLRSEVWCPLSVQVSLWARIFHSVYCRFRRAPGRSTGSIQMKSSMTFIRGI